jgi:hypothetical protein
MSYKDTSFNCIIHSLRESFIVNKNHNCNPLRVRSKLLVLVREYHQKKNLEEKISSNENNLGEYVSPSG